MTSSRFIDANVTYTYVNLRKHDTFSSSTHQVVFVLYIYLFIHLYIYLFVYLFICFCSVMHGICFAFRHVIFSPAAYPNGASAFPGATDLLHEVTMLKTKTWGELNQHLTVIATSIEGVAISLKKAW